MTLLYIPNIIDYVRIACVVFFLWNDNNLEVRKAALWYLASTVLDEFDGRLARYFNQCSSFGSQLDYAIDYSSTMLIFMSFYSNVTNAIIRIYIIFFIWLDITVHQFWNTSMSKTNTKTHTGPSDGRFMFSLLRTYYTNKSLFRIMVFYDSTIIPLTLYAHTNSMIEISFTWLALIILLGSLRRIVQIQKLIQAVHEILIENED